MGKKLEDDSEKGTVIKSRKVWKTQMVGLWSMDIRWWKYGDCTMRSSRMKNFI